MKGKKRIWIKKNKDKNVRRNFKKNEINLIMYKYSMNWDIKKEDKNLLNKLNYKNFYFYNFIKKFHLNSSSARINNRCIFTSRTRWPLRKFKLSRMSFKNLFDKGLIHGVRKSSW